MKKLNTITWFKKADLEKKTSDNNIVVLIKKSRLGFTTSIRTGSCEGVKDLASAIKVIHCDMSNAEAYHDRQTGDVLIIEKKNGVTTTYIFRELNKNVCIDGFKEVMKYAEEGFEKSFYRVTKPLYWRLTEASQIEWIDANYRIELDDDYRFRVIYNETGAGDVFVNYKYKEPVAALIEALRGKCNSYTPNEWLWDSIRNNPDAKDYDRRLIEGKHYCSVVLPKWCVTAQKLAEVQ